MNFLFVQTAKSTLDIPWTLLELGHTVETIEHFAFDPLAENLEGYNALEAKIKSSPFDFVITYLFFPTISDICFSYKIPYISWTYDSPLISLFHKSILHPTNYIFLFDKSEFEYFKQFQVPHLYYLPMGTNISRTGALSITKEDEQKFSCDVSFVGNLYENNTYNYIIQSFPEPLALELKTYLMENLCKWDTKRTWPRLSASVVDFMVQNFNSNDWRTFDIDLDLYLGLLVLTRKLGEMERLTILNTLSENYCVELYTNSQSPFLENIHTHSAVTYETDMNKIFYLSKINLNITLPSIETGLPQRIFDIMGCGGFVLTNYQEEIPSLFEIGKDIEVFHDLTELKEKTNYYLTHEKERLAIAMNGYKKICFGHAYTHRIQQILTTVLEDLS